MVRGLYEFTGGIEGLMRRCLAKCLESLGYEVRRVGVGQNPFVDVIRLAGKREIGTVFDVGGNVGQTVTEVCRYFPGSIVYSFEPFSIAFEQLRAAARGRKNVFVYNLGFGSRDCDATLFLNKDSATNSLLQNHDLIARFADNPEAVVPVGTAPVTMRRLDNFCDENNIASVDLLKIDTQGYELHVLGGAGRLLDGRRIRFIYLEVLFTSLYKGQADFCDVYCKLKEAGYGLVSLYGPKRTPEGLLKWCDALFIPCESYGEGEQWG